MDSSVNTELWTQTLLQNFGRSDKRKLKMTSIITDALFATEALSVS